MTTTVILDDDQLKSLRWGCQQLLRVTHTHKEEFGPDRFKHMVFFTQACQMIEGQVAAGKHEVVLAHV